MKGLIFIHLICFALGANQTLKNLISDGHYVPLIEELSEVNAGQKMVILIDVETNSSLRTCLQNAYSNKNVTLFCIHLPKREIPDIEYHIETIGDNVAELIFNMCKNNTININNLELVCNGIGCDVAGIAGKKFTQRKLNENQLRKIPNIIAFNPTGLNKFEDFDLNSNLQPEDADKVVVFHTNDAFRGDGTRLGTLDIFLNGDAYQPSCVSEENADKCSHQFACEFYAGLLTNTDVTMIAYDYEKFVEAREEGDIHIAQGEQLSSLDQLLSKTGSYIVKTTPKPYSFEEFQVMRLEEIPSFFCGSFNPYKDIDIELYSPNHRVHPAVIQYNDIEKFGDEYFNKSWPTKVIIHGFISGNNWFDDLAPHFSEKIYGTNSGVLNHHNLISINWRKGASYTYMCAHQFVESVGNLAGDFIYRASNAQKMNLSTVEIIGHSLGAHVAGFIGKSVHSQSKGKMSIQRIIALDAAGPCFHSMIPPFTCLFLRHDLELKREDANEVIALHTNSRKIMQVSSIFPLFSKGYWGLLGTVDLWLNGGMVQDDNTNILSHLFAVKYYLHIMYMEKPLTGYTFNFDDVDSKYTETAMLEEMKKNYMNPIEKVSIFFNETLNQKLGNRIALFVDTNSVENDPTIP